ncbi:short-chain dehydrogenase [Diaporthe sp. PMI_573]|nr:short-chain dehydrogenase [Diaporthaceae sp. PMI_573]
MHTGMIYLITGAKSGLGKGFVSAALQLPSSTVIAAVRDPSNESSKALAALPKADGSKLIVVKINSASESDASNAVASLQKHHGIESLDVVIANAAIGNSGTSVAETSIDAITEHFAVNIGGPIALLRATIPLLKNSKSGRPRFVTISSTVGSIAGLDQLPGSLPMFSPYGGTKAALNWFTRRIHFEESWLISVVFSPGVVLTAMSAPMLQATGARPEDVGAVTVEESVGGMMEKIDSATREISGTFQSYDGIVVPW